MLLGNIQADALRHYLQADAAYLKNSQTYMLC